MVRAGTWSLNPAPPVLLVRAETSRGPGYHSVVEFRVGAWGRKGGFWWILGVSRVYSRVHVAAAG